MPERFDKAARVGVPAKGLRHYLSRLQKARRRGNARKIAKERTRGSAPRRHSRMSLPARQNTPALDAAIYRPDGTLYQLQPSFHT